jgi:hypothetical protein
METQFAQGQFTIDNKYQPFLVIPLPDQEVTTAAGETINMPTETVWRPICGSRPIVTASQLAKMAANHEAEIKAGFEIVNEGALGPGGLNVVFQLGSSVPSAAVPSFVAAELYLEAQFPADPMTITISVSFAALQSGVIGGTSSSYGQTTYPTARTVLVDDMDSNDLIQAFLPATTTVPVRYRTSSTTNEDRVFFTFANWKANGGTIAGNDGSMQFSTNFPFDYDPSNGVGGSTISLVDVIIHEVGHAMGCTSGVDFRNRDIECLDLFRFRNTDGNADFNPDTNAEFTVRPRWAVFNNPNNDVNFDTISSEIPLSDGSPYQASHLRELFPAIGIMDPAFAFGETFYPNYLRSTDLTVFDSIGYDQ